MAVIATISSSPSTTSRTDAVLADVTRRMQRAGHVVAPLVLRDLPPAALLQADTTDPQIAAAVDTIAAADAVVVSTPVYKAAYGGLLKVFLDLLPQFALRDKVVLPLATGGSSAHVLAVDYALRPVLASLAASSITPGWFVLASQVNVFDDGEVLLDESAAGPLKEVADVFLDVVAGRSLLKLATVREAVA
ncbi:MAG TPA: NADPH-dependent FMN reductase [Actinomycetales bacterium]|nr:NADPH-dependent FMN reductase [Actinomycetales bacterium]